MIDDTIDTSTKLGTGDFARPSGDIAAFEPGTMLHQYEIIRELGRGGMGIVLMARDTILGRRVAIKLLTSATPDHGRRFLDEARMTAQLGHENIVVIHEVNEYSGVPYMVLEYLEGEPLAKRVRETGIPWPKAVELVVPIVRALARAHEFGIVHRDMKPDNVVLTRDGVVKVLDFGIAKAFTTDAANDEGIAGTLPYMSPEQLGMGTIDARTDLWAIGIIFWELLAGRHPLAPITPGRLFESAALLDDPLPRIGGVITDLPEMLERAIDGCLAKRADRRIASANDLLALLEPLMPGRSGRMLGEGESPYIGLAAFQEGDAGRFFGRTRDIGRAVARLVEQPLVVIAGPSGVGKSSFVRAGVIPALKSGTERWEAFVVRPGREPFAALASLVASLSPTDHADHAALAERLRTEPGYLGTVLRARARQKAEKILLFVDQFEELYTLVASETERHAFAESLAALADDSATSLRVVLSMRSDFLDRVAESDRLVAELARGLIFLVPPDAAGLREALLLPLEPAGYQFESPSIIDDMMATLQTTPGALPLLQFVASRLWDVRDHGRRLLTKAAYEAMGGISGALATHADDAVAQMSPEALRIVRAIFQRLVTPEGTRAIVDAVDLCALAPTMAEGQRVLDQLVHARLVIVQARGDSEHPAVELVHESLIAGWPRLRGWLDESQDEAAFVARLETAAKHWDASGRSQDLLWRGDAADEARRFAARTKRVLPERERAYLDAVIRLATRSTRVKRIAIGAVIAMLSLVIVATLFALAQIQSAKQEATAGEAKARREKDQARAAEKAAKAAEEVAKREREKASAAEKESAERLRAIQDRDKDVAKGKKDLATAYAEIQRALATETAARADADAANAKLKRVLAEKDRELQQLKKTNRPF